MTCALTLRKQYSAEPEPWSRISSS